jgi:diguanylate cyclase (GGDEF)-like protein/PAS domain S-box-containing protein
VRRNAAEQRWRLIGQFLGHTAEAILITDARSRIVFANRAFSRITGYTLKEVAGKSPRVLHSGRQSADFYAHMWKCLKATGQWQGEIWNRRRNGEIYPEWLSISAVRGANGKVEHYLAIFSDITLRKREERELYDLATHDALTGLANRSFFNERFRHAMVRAKRANQLVGLLYLDLDDFKPVNDRLGHRCGDLLLQTVAARLRRSVREEDTIARLGGDEFAVILEHLSRAQDAAASARKLLRTVARPYLLEGRRARVTASIGIAVYPADGEDVETLVNRADGAMYRAKTERRNDFRFWKDPARYAPDGATARKAASRPQRRPQARPPAGRTARSSRARRESRAGSA